MSLGRVWMSFVLLVCAVEVSGARIEGRVTAVADGDSFTLTDARQRSYRVRIQGIDAPERAQAFSYAAKKALSDLLFGREVAVSVQKTDQHGRIVGSVTVNGRDAGLEQLRGGHAWFYSHYGGEMRADDRLAYIDAQRQARGARRGLWAGAQPVPPWQFRRSQPRRRGQ